MAVATGGIETSVAHIAAVDPEECERARSDALYHAKRSGGNTIRLL